VVSVINQLIPVYRKIIWNSGDLGIGTVGDGNKEKSDDFALLQLFCSQHTDTCGIYFSGDGMAEEWFNMTSTSSQNFINTFIPYVLITGDHTDLHGISPYGVGMPGSIFDHDPAPPFPDTLVSYGGCPINAFDVIEPVAPSVREMAYEGNADSPAVISCTMINGEENPVRIVLSGFSFHYIRDDRPAGILDRVHHLTDIVRFLGNPQDDPTPLVPRLKFTNHLAQNYPNPFNPVTTIKYSIKERAHVSLKVYNVAGQLVKTLVNEEQVPRIDGYTVTWDSRNNSGQEVASGVYFYRLVTKGFTKCKKLIVLK
jgi:hypothetical protein